MAMSPKELEAFALLIDMVILLARKVDNSTLSDSERIDLTVNSSRLQDMRKLVKE